MSSPGSERALARMACVSVCSRVCRMPANCELRSSDWGMAKHDKPEAREAARDRTGFRILNMSRRREQRLKTQSARETTFFAPLRLLHFAFSSRYHRKPRVFPCVRVCVECPLPNSTAENAEDAERDWIFNMKTERTEVEGQERGSERLWPGWRVPAN